jgi:uncharacterized membrane protein (DUF4010 family)
MDVIEIFQRLGTAAALGLLVGLQREHAGTHLAGIRTFPLVTILGGVCALMAGTPTGAVVAAGFLGVVALLVVGNLRQQVDGPRDGAGITTEVAVLLMFALGAYLMHGELVVGVVVAGVLAVLLHLKPQMHALVQRISPTDFKAVMQFVLISLVILPLLPDQTYGPYDVLNPRNIWWMVVLIVGVQLAAFVLYRLAGQGAGSLLGGVLGGLVSSTATTVAYARQAHGAPAAAPLAAAVIMLASTVALVRVMVVAALVAPQAAASVAWPLATLLGVLVLLSLVQLLLAGRAHVHLPEAGNPAELKPALFFAGLYALVTLAIAAAGDWLGHQGLYLVALVSGLTDMDAVTLSTTRLLSQDRLVAEVAWRVILLAALSNLVFKGASAYVLGGAALGRRVLILFGIALVSGIVLFFVWPG